MINSSTITLGDAVKESRPTAFSTMVKPAGSACNLDCSYCYYLDKAIQYGGKEAVMSDELLREYIRQYITANAAPEVTFCWHGGEPLLLGLDFYKKAMAWQREYSYGKKIVNTIQTNATLIDDRWAEFFRMNNFLVGVSLDGPEDIHDGFRRDKMGRPTWERVMISVDLLRRFGVEFNTLSVVSSLCEGRGKEIYSFFKSIGSHYMQFLPAVEHVVDRPDFKRPVIVSPETEGARLAPWCVSAEGYGKFLNDIFDEWVRQDVGEYFVNLFDAALAGWCGVRPGLCVYGETCGDNASLEHNGDLYPCDHFVYPKYLLGNIAEKGIAEMMDSEAMVQFGIAKRTGLPRACRACEWLHLCHGECPKHRFNRTESGETGLNALCGGYRKFFAHSAPYMKKMRELLEQDLAPALVMSWARARR